MPSYLEQLTRHPLAQPCAESWDIMVGDDRARHCARCEKRVYNLSAMSPLEAEVRLLNAGGHPCIQYQLDPAGQVLMRPEPARSSSMHLNTAVWVAGALSVATVGSQARAEPKVPPAATASSAPGSTAPAQAPEQCAKDAAPRSAPAPAPPGKNQPPPEPPRLAGVPVMVQEEPWHGSLEVKSSRPLRIMIRGMEFQVPAPTIVLPPGAHPVVVYDGKTVVKKLSVTIKKDQKTVLDLK